MTGCSAGGAEVAGAPITVFGSETEASSVDDDGAGGGGADVATAVAGTVAFDAGNGGTGRQRRSRRTSSGTGYAITAAVIRANAQRDRLTRWTMISVLVSSIGRSAFANATT